MTEGDVQMPSRMAIGIGIVFLVMSGIALFTGRLKYSSTTQITRADRPQAYWTLIALAVLLGVAALALGAMQSRPHG